MAILAELFGTWTGMLSLLTIAFIFGMGVFIFLYVRRRMNE